MKRTALKYYVLSDTTSRTKTRSIYPNPFTYPLHPTPPPSSNTCYLLRARPSWRLLQRIPVIPNPYAIEIPSPTAPRLRCRTKMMSTMIIQRSVLDASLFRLRMTTIPHTIHRKIAVPNLRMRSPSPTLKPPYLQNSRRSLLWASINSRMAQP